MNNIRPHLKFNWPAVVLLVIFFVALSSQVASLAHPSLGNGCTMECCEEEGFCCCAEERWAWQEQNPAASETPQLNKTSKNCVSNCATLPASSSDLSLAKIFVLPDSPCSWVTLSVSYQSNLEFQEFLQLKKSAPRAPPLYS